MAKKKKTKVVDAPVVEQEVAVVETPVVVDPPRDFVPPAEFDNDTKNIITVLIQHLHDDMMNKFASRDDENMRHDMLQSIAVWSMLAQRDNSTLFSAVNALLFHATHRYSVEFIGHNGENIKINDLRW